MLDQNKFLRRGAYIFLLSSFFWNQLYSMPFSQKISQNVWVDNFKKIEGLHLLNGAELCA